MLLKRAMHTAHQFSNIIGNSSADAGRCSSWSRRSRRPAAPCSSPASRAPARSWSRARSTCDSPRSDRPFVAVNCGALPETLLESELFGHMRGAFTGADSNKKGLFEVADKGTIFLDEIGEMSPMRAGQAAARAAGAEVPPRRRHRGGRRRHPDHRRDQPRPRARWSPTGTFREDLFYRINVIPMRAAAAARAAEDIPLLAEHFVAKFARADEEADRRHLRRRAGAAAGAHAGRATSASSRTRWSGRWRSSGRRRSCPRACPSSSRRRVGARRPRRRGVAAADGRRFPTKGFDLEQHVQHIEREYIAEALRRSGGVKVKAAELLGMSFRSFRYYTKKYNLK